MGKAWAPTVQVCQGPYLGASSQAPELCTSNGHTVTSSQPPTHTLGRPIILVVPQRQTQKEASSGHSGLSGHRRRTTV